MLQCSAMQLLWKEVKKYKGLLAGVLVLATINQVASMLTPQFSQRIIDNYALKAHTLTKQEFIHGVLILILLAMVVTLISRIAKAFQDYFTNVIIQRSGTNLYAQSVNHAFSLPYSVFEDNRSGELLSKLQKARTDSQALINNAVNILFLSLVGIIFGISYAAFVHWLIGLVYFLMIPTIGGIIFFLSRKIKAAQAAIVKATADLSGSTTETLRNVELVKSLGLEDQEVARLNSVNEKILALELNKVKMVRRLDFIQGTLLNAISSAIMFLLFWFIFQGTITIGQYLTLWIYTFFIFEPLRAVGLVATSYQEAKASLNQLQEILKLEPVPIPVDAVVLESLQDISYKDASLLYKGAEQEALSQINLTIKSGESIAFVGPSGSGKSSMIKLISGLYEPSSGSVSFNGIDLRQVNLMALRKRIGLVAQETQLFSGTIRENLGFVKPNASDEEMTNALRSAQAETILNKGVEGARGLDTKIGEGGVKLSGGERQRLAIARALLRKPDLIVFDEATSSLDSITESAITETIKKIKQGEPELIQVLVAHRLSTIAHADKIYVFEKGKIIESGTHSSLIAAGGLYSALWREQIGQA
jgi:ATP-binding cassette, subfamily B, bacterial